MENANVDELRMRIMHHKNNLDLCVSVIDDLKTVKEFINKTVEGTITEDETTKFDEMKSENRISGLIYEYDEDKSLSENIDKEISQNESRLEYIKERIEVYEQRADQAEAEEEESDDSSAGNVYEVDFDDIGSDNEMDIDSNYGDRPHSDENPEDSNNSPDNDESQSPTEYVAELESTLPGDFIGGGDD